MQKKNILGHLIVSFVQLYKSFRLSLKIFHPQTIYICFVKIIYKSLKSNNFDREIYTFVDNGKEEYLIVLYNYTGHPSLRIFHPRTIHICFTKIIYTSLKSNNFDQSFFRENLSEIYTFVGNEKEEYLIATFYLAQLFFFIRTIYICFTKIIFYYISLKFE